MQKSEQPNGWPQIERLMRENGLSAREIAKIAGVVPSAVQNWKRGKSINPVSLLNIAKRFGVSVEFLLVGNVPSYPESTGQGQTPMVAREPRAEYGTPPTPVCRFPSDCDLQKNLDALNADMTAVKNQMNEIRLLLVSLLAEERTRNAQPHAGPIEKAG